MTILLIIALIFTLIELVRSKAQSLLAWAVLFILLAMGAHTMLVGAVK